MADKAKTTIVGRDALIGYRYGLRLLAETYTASRDTIWGSRYGLTLLAETINAHRETIWGLRYGLNLKAEASPVSRDALIGSRVGRNLKAEASPVIVEYLIKDKYAKTWKVQREALVSLIEPISAPWRVGQDVETLMQAATRADPPTVWSDNTVPSYRETVVQERTLTDVRSPIVTSTERQQATQARTTTPAADMRSPIRIGSHAEVVVRSRGLTTIKISAVYSAQLEQRTVQVRTTLGVLRSFIRTSTEHQIITMSRLAAVPTNIDDQAGSEHQLIAQARTPAVPFSSDHVASLHEQIIVQRLPSDVVNDVVAEHIEQAIQMRATPDVLSALSVPQLNELTLQARSATDVISMNVVGSQYELVTTYREVALPGYLLGWSARTTMQQATQVRVTLGILRSPITVGAQQVQYTMFRTTLPPSDVISPDVGRHAASLHQQSVMLREVESPTEIAGKQRVVYGVIEHAAHADGSFPPPPVEDLDPVVIEAASVGLQAVLQDPADWMPVALATVYSPAQQLVVGDSEDWPDPLLPQSQIVALTALAHAVLGDPSFPSSDTPQSGVAVVAALSQAAVGDASFPPTTQPQSMPSVYQSVETTVVKDDSFPAGDLPASQAAVLMLGQSTLRHDPSMSGPLPMSPVDLYVMAQAVVVRDITVNRIPTRPRGPRPSVSAIRC